MIHASDSLRTIQDLGAARFEHTRLASDLSEVTRTVRRQRAVRTGLGAAAGVAAIGAVALGTQFFRSESTPAPIASAPSPSASAEPSSSAQPSVSAEPTPASSPTASAEESSLTVTPGARIERTAEALAERFDVSEDRASEALIGALPPITATSSYQPELPVQRAEGWVATPAVTLSTVGGQAQAMVDAQIQRLEELGVAQADWQHAITLASILEKEAPERPEDMARVARVIENRLAAGMMLELESPLVYITRADERTVSDDGFVVDSPFNTFMYEGLPPTAIGSTSEASLEAAVNPAEGDWLYFLRNGDTGEILLATTFHEHQLNAVELGLIEESDVLPE